VDLVYGRAPTPAGYGLHTFVRRVEPNTRCRHRSPTSPSPPGSWTGPTTPKLGTSPLDYSAFRRSAYYEAERGAIFNGLAQRRAGGALPLAKNDKNPACYFTEGTRAATPRFPGPGPGRAGRAFHIILRQNGGNSWFGTNFPGRGDGGTCRPVSTHCKLPTPGVTAWTASWTFIPQEDEFSGRQEPVTGLKRCGCEKSWEGFQLSSKPRP